MSVKKPLYQVVVERSRRETWTLLETTDRRAAERLRKRLMNVSGRNYVVEIYSVLDSLSAPSSGFDIHDDTLES